MQVMSYVKLAKNLTVTLIGTKSHLSIRRANLAYGLSFFFFFGTSEKLINFYLHCKWRGVSGVGGRGVKILSVFAFAEQRQHQQQGRPERGQTEFVGW
jgi:hypothetical protein